MRQPLRKTPLIVKLEREYGKPLLQLLTETLQAEGSESATARRLDVPVPTLRYWLLRLGIETRIIVLAT